MSLFSNDETKSNDEFNVCVCVCMATNIFDSPPILRRFKALHRRM